MRAGELEFTQRALGRGRGHSLRRGVRGFLLILVAVLIDRPPVANAAEWPRLPDGRIVVEMNSVRLAFPSQGDGLEAVYFDLLPRQDKMTLKQVLEQPGKAQTIFAKRASNSVFVGVPDKGLLLGRFSVRDYIGINFAIGTGEDRRRLCEEVDREVAQRRRALAEGKSQASADGFAQFGTESVNSSAYYLVASEALRSASSFDQISCDGLFMCRVTKCLGDNARFSFSFGAKLHPRPTWPAVLEKAQAVLDSVLIDRLARGGAKQ